MRDVACVAPDATQNHVCMLRTTAQRRAPHVDAWSRRIETVLFRRTQKATAIPKQVETMTTNKQNDRNSETG